MQKLVIALTLSLAVAVPLAAWQQLRSKLVINTSTPEGQLMQQIGQESDAAKKLALMEQFIAKYPQHEGVAWVYGQMQESYTKSGDFDKAIAAGEKVLAADPNDLEATYANLKAAVGKKDPDLVVKWSAATSALAKKAAGAAKAADEEDEQFAKKVEYAKQVDTYTEYSLYATAAQLQDPPKIIALSKELETRNANSQYLVQLYPTYFIAQRQAGDVAGAVETGERAAAKNAANEDMLLVMADYYMQQKKDPAKVIACSNKLVEYLGAKQKPEGMSDADWDKKKTTTLGVANWMAGVTYASQSNWAETDKSLRAALPLIKGGDATMNAAALFHLGVANYNMGKASRSRATMGEALKFSEQCAAMASPFKAPAAGNARAIRAEMLKLPAKAK
jgi:tetratricopeptide (TPR) repeat protein